MTAGTAAGAPETALSFEDARRRLHALMIPVQGLERVELASATGRVLATDLHSPIDVPAHDNAAMDGFAFAGASIAAGGGARLAIVGAALAGHPFERELLPGEAIRITTGAVMPAGADTVLMHESARLESDGACLVVPAGVTPGQHRRLRGEDLAHGACAIAGGTLLGPAAVGLAASLGLSTLQVRRRIRVAYFSTGDEVLDVGDAPRPGRIFDSNRHTIGALLRRPSIELLDLGRIPDSPVAIESALGAALGAPRVGPGGNRAVGSGEAAVDAILSSGGMSFGEADHARRVLEALGEVAFHQVDMRPGRPLAFGRIGSACFVGLPGNPVAAMVAFRFLVQPALHALMGARPREVPMLRVRLASSLRKRRGRTEFPRARLQRAADGHWNAVAYGEQGSGILRSMHEADCILVLPPDVGDLVEGAWVDAVSTDGLA
ncbi:MAG: molybdopterin molybdotransferase MoeA [Lautropia sp.]